MVMKQTAVEWLVEQLEKHYVSQDIKNTVVFVQAKSMEKKQILQSLNDGKSMALGNLENKSLEQYYNETFNK